MTEPKTRSKTAEEILDIAEMLIQTRGYSASSYQDISEVLGIRKASIHYHYPSKTDLGVAVIERYAERFEGALDAIAQDRSKSALDMLECYTQPYLEFGDTPDRVCLCGALAGEILALPVEMRRRVENFFEAHHKWLTRIVQRAVKSGECRLAEPPKKIASMIFGALQGALLVKRTTGDAAQLRDVVAVLKTQLSSAG